ncbi:MAG TPA: molybdate ABC transporter substrate-binding protein [Thermoanaerobaculia bacterium]|nr:molybdate ABC transporter substrate-binding protein [Thermoanaerobaculia bacterium]
MRALFVVAILSISLPAAAKEIRVFAAVSLTEPLQEIERGYERAYGVDIVFHFGASSLLSRQIEQGAPADLFLSADEASVGRLGKLVIRRASVLSNSLVIVVPKDNRTITRPVHLLRARRIALAEPSTVPAGIYARKWLQKIGLWQRIAPNVIPTDNVRAALAAVESGNVDGAIVYKTDARIAKRSRVACEVPRAETPGISYPFALLRDARNGEAATKLLAYLSTKGARDVFAKHGFLIQ